MAMYSPQVEAARQGLKSELAQTTMRARRALFKDADLPTSEWPRVRLVNVPNQTRGRALYQPAETLAHRPHCLRRAGANIPLDFRRFLQWMSR